MSSYVTQLARQCFNLSIY